MRLMLLVSSMQAGGAERVAATLSSAWAARGDEVTLVVTYSGRGECHFRLNDGVKLVYLVDRVKGPRWRHAAYAMRLIGLWRLIREKRPDVVVSFLTNVNINAIFATRGSSIPLIVCERSDPVANTETGWLLSALRRRLYPLADMVTVQTEAAVERFRAHIPAMRSLEVVPNPLPPELLEAAAEAHRPATQRRRLISMGRLAPEKQFDHVIDVFAELSSRFPDVDLWIWGEGPLRGALERRVANAGLTGRVFLPGRTDAPWAELLASDVFVMTSSFEGFPNALLEAMGLGLPCVAYDCSSGPREITDGGRAAILVPQGRREQLRDAIASLLADAAMGEHLGRLAANVVRARYALPSVLARWDALFAQVRNVRALAPFEAR